eukprot:1161266-Amphidinium_carterae.1
MWKLHPLVCNMWELCGMVIGLAAGMQSDGRMYKRQSPTTHTQEKDKEVKAKKDNLQAHVLTPALADADLGRLLGVGHKFCSPILNYNQKSAAQAQGIALAFTSCCEPTRRVLRGIVDKVLRDMGVVVLEVEVLESCILCVSHVVPKNVAVVRNAIYNVLRNNAAVILVVDVVEVDVAFLLC